MNLRGLGRLQVAAVFGVAGLAGLTLYSGVGGVGRAMIEAGWGAALIVLIRFVQVMAAGFAWRSVVLAGVNWWVCPLLRWVREAINALLPVAQVGGEIVGARLLARFGVKGATATASVLADLLVQVVTQLVFCLLGLGLFFLQFGETDLLLWLSGGLLLLTLGVVGFFGMQRWGGIGWIERRIVAMAISNGWPVPDGIVGLKTTLEAIHGRPRRLGRAAAIHMAIWIFGASEIWVALHFLAQPVDFREAIVLESLSHAARAALFIVPGGIGVQEGALVALGAAYGLSPQLALTIGLLKRIPDIVLGLSGLLIWQALEFRRVGSRSKEVV